MASDAAPATSVYRPRHPETTVLYQLFERHFDEYRGVYDERFEHVDGPWRAVVDKAVASYLECGRLHGGFARLRCGTCGAEHLLAFSCQTRNFCPSCQAKRAALFAERLEQEIVPEVPLRHFVFTIPKALRGLFRRERKLLGLLSRTAFDAVRITYQAFFDRRDVVPGGVVSIQTFGSYGGNFHPHIHALISEGVFTPEGALLPLLFIDVKAIEKLFQKLLLRRLHQKERLSETFIERIDTWQHSGFSLYAEQVIMPHEKERLERLARYLTRPPLKLSALSWDQGRVRVETPFDPRSGATELVLDPIELIHRIASQIPDPGIHLTRYYGAFANRVRKSRLPRKPSAETLREPPAEDPQFLKARKASWARLIRRVFEADPVLCPRCQLPMDIVSVITDPTVVDHILRHRLRHGIDSPFDSRPPPAPTPSPSSPPTRSPPTR